MNSCLNLLRGLLLAGSLGMVPLCALAQKGGNLITPYFSTDAKVRATVFENNPTVKKGGSGQKSPVVTPATGVATIANGQVTGVRVTEKGYFRTEVRLEAVFSGGGGSGAAGRVEVGRLDAMVIDWGYISSWFVKGVQITNPGSGYTSPPTVTFVVKP